MAKTGQKRKLPSSASAATSAPAVPTVDLSYIAEGLRPLAVPVSDLVLDPRNARDHGEGSISGIAASLREFGIRKPAVVRRATRVVIAGNGSIQAARLNGWTHYPVVLVDDDDRTATKFAIADNRTAELSAWNQEQLSALLSEVEADDDELRRVFDDLAAELPGLAEAAAASAQQALSESAPDATASPGIVGRESKAKWQIVIQCKDQEDQKRLLQRFTDEGLQFTAKSPSK